MDRGEVQRKEAGRLAGPGQGAGEDEQSQAGRSQRAFPSPSQEPLARDEPQQSLEESRPQMPMGKSCWWQAAGRRILGV